MVDRAFKLNVGRQGFGSVNPEIRIIEGRISEVLLYSQITFHLDERHSLNATVLESGQKCINWISVGNFETLS